MTVLYVVDEVIVPERRSAYRSDVTMYMYAILDLFGRELFAYHWHPDGVSPSRTPHFHASSMPPALLSGQPASSESGELALNRVHFPTHRIELPELVEFLIRELDVAPRRPDWEAVLDGMRR